MRAKRSRGKRAVSRYGEFERRVAAACPTLQQPNDIRELCIMIYFETGSRIDRLVSDARRHFKTQGRAHLPWRRTRDPYKVLVSEVMLQQTQVERVIPFYKNFLREFPNAQRLSEAELSRVLTAWQGLGYNRRAKYLHGAAKEVVEKWHGKFPRTAAEIESLPGVGPYTARAVAAFAFNSPEVFIETNIRTVFLQHCFASRRTKVSDKEILLLVAEAFKRSKMEPREFYAALMDYGAHLKRSGMKLNAKSKHYAKQSKFEGSARQLRGHILKLLLQKPHTERSLVQQTGRSSADVRAALADLQKEKMITKQGSLFIIAA